VLLRDASLRPNARSSGCFHVVLPHGWTGKPWRILDRLLAGFFQDHMSTKIFAIGSLLLVMVIWGSSLVVTKALETEIPPLALAMLRFVIASALLIPIAHERGGLTQLPRPIPWDILTLMGFTGVTLYIVTANLGLIYTTASDAALIQGSTPALTAVLAIVLLGERLDRSYAVGIALSIIGVALIVLTGHHAADAPGRLLGDLLVVGSVLAWSIYTILGKRLQHAAQVAITAYSTLLGTFFLLPLGLANLAIHPPRAVSPTGWVALFYLGAISSALSYLLWNRALPFLDASQQGNFLNLVPVVGVVTAVLFLGERPTFIEAGGGILVLAGVWLTARG
jgi:drug/metabolite transporter (DMT)-like permease